MEEYTRKRSPGRPPLAEGRMTPAIFPLRADQKAYLDRKADESGRSMSAIVRDLIDREMEATP